MILRYFGPNCVIVVPHSETLVMNGVALTYRVILSIAVLSGKKLESSNSTHLYLDWRMKNINSRKSQYFQSFFSSLKLHN